MNTSQNPQKTQANSRQGKIFTPSPKPSPETNRLVSDVAAAVRAALKAAGFPDAAGHAATILAALSAAAGRTETFEISAATLGRLHSNATRPDLRRAAKGNGPKAEAAKKEIKRQANTLAQRWRRAYAELDAAQIASGEGRDNRAIVFVDYKAGARPSAQAKRTKGRLRVNVEVFAQIIEAARADTERYPHAARRPYAFEMAARKVIANTERETRRATPTQSPDERAARLRKNELRRRDRSLETFQKNLETVVFVENSSGTAPAEILRMLTSLVESTVYAATGFANHESSTLVQGDNFKLQDVTYEFPVNVVTTGDNPESKDFQNSGENAPSSITGGAEIHPSPSETRTPKETKAGDSPPALSLSSGLAMLGAFASVGVETFDVKRLAYETNKPLFHEPELSTKALAAQLESLLGKSLREKSRLVILPKDGPTKIVHLDDLSAETLKRVEPFAFLVTQTSPGRFHAFLALRTDDKTETRKRLIAELGADKNASCSAVLAGSHNFKPKRRDAEGNYPEVLLIAKNAGRNVTPEELEAAGLLAAVETKPATPAPVAVAPNLRREIWPIYPENPADRSKADFSLACRALEWGFPPEAVEAKLESISSKAAERNDPAKYARKTVRAAAKSLGLAH